MPRMGTEIEVIKVGNNVAMVDPKGSIVTNWQVNGDEVFYPYRLPAAGGDPCGGLTWGGPWAGPSPKGCEFEDFENGYLQRMGWMPSVRPSESEVRMNLFDMGEVQYPHKILHELAFEVASNSGDNVATLATRLWGKCQGVDRQGVNEFGAPINYIINSFFNTPNGATIISGQCQHEHKGDTYGPVISPIINGTVVIELHGIGRLKLGASRNLKYMLLWTSSREYFCVAPIMGFLEDFNKPEGLYVQTSDEISATCFFIFEWD